MPQGEQNQGSAQTTVSAATVGTTGQAPTPEGDDNQKLLHQRLVGLREKLLDLSNRNRLLSFKHSDRSRTHIRIIDELPDVLFAKLRDGEKLTFEALPEPESKPLDEEADEFLLALEAARATDEEYRRAIRALAEAENQPQRESEIERALHDRVREWLGMPPWIDETGLSKEELARSHGLEPDYDAPHPHGDEGDEDERHLDKLIQTLLFPREMDRKLAGIRDQARTMHQEAGVNTLYAAFGFLEWREARQSDKKHFSPLLLLPVSLEYKRGQPWGKYRLFSELPDVETNKTLEIRLGRDSGFKMPQFGEDDTPETFLQKFGEAIQDRPDWRVRRFLTVGNFGFSKLAMYNDLDPANWPPDQALDTLELIRKLLLGSPLDDDAPIYAEDYSIDSPAIDDKQIALITDADASQHSAVMDAIEGKNLVIKGPPGTGKSQTITNIIAASLAKGKRVLFVSEKMAALEVVESRLEDAGLTDFCLQVHSSKTSKMKVLESMRRRLDLQHRVPAPDLLDDKLAELRDQRDRLNHYVTEMNRPLGAMDLTVHQIFWGENRTKADGGEACSLLRSVEFEGSDSIDTLMRSQAHSAIESAFDRAAELANQFASLDQHPWFWLKNEALNPFEVEALENAGRAWLETLNRLSSHTEGFAAQFATLEAACTQRLRDTVDAIAALPDPSGPFVSTLASSLVDLDVQDTASRLSVLLSSDNDNVETLTRVFRSDALPSLPEDWHSKARRISEAIGTIEQHSQGLDNTARVHDEIACLQRDSERLDRLLSIVAQLNSAAGLTVELTQGSVAVALTAIGLLKETTREALLHRDLQVLDETAEIPLSRAAAKSCELTSLRKDLEQLMVLRPLPTLKDVTVHTAALRGAGAFGFLNRRVREAKLFIRSLATNPRRLKIAQMIERGTKLVAYLDDRRLLIEDWHLIGACGSWFDGAETNFQLLLEVNHWGRNVRRRLPEGDEYAALRQFLLEGPADVIGDLAAKAEHVDIEDAIQLVKRLKNHGFGIEQTHELLTERIDSLKAATVVLEGEDIGSEAPFAVIADAIQCIAHLEPLRARIAGKDSSRSITSALLGEALDLIASVAHAGLPLSMLEGLASENPETNMEGLRTWSRETSECLAVEAERRAAFANLADIHRQRFCDGDDLDVAPVSTLRDRLRLAIANGNGLKDYLGFQGALNIVGRSTPPGFVEALIANPPSSQQAVAAYDWLLFRGLAKMAFEQIPALSRFHGLDLQSARQKFQKLDREIIKLERERLRSTLCGRRIPYGNGVGRKSSFTNLALIENELGKRKRHIPLRQLFVRAASAIKQMKPCFMMSPLSAATYLQAGKFEFDLVVIDEASQMPPEDALGVIARSAQVVVVGDPMQLPPTSFFRRFDDVMDDDDEEEDENIDVESILDQAYAVFRPPRELRLHYRSRHQSLIAFSNKHFYNDGLTVFPSPIEEDENRGVRLIKVDGLYADQHNPIEAREMADWAHNFMMTRPKESLGLVAINQLQRDLLMDEMERIFQRDSRADAYRRNWEGTLYPFFVKNLENVQGDERDVIAVSLVRGPNADGKVTQNFGPISQKNGHRRLNVLFTRARNQLVIFSSITPEQIVIRPHTALGPRILRSFLDYALTGRLDPGGDTERLPDSDFEVAVANRLRGYGYEVVPQVGVGGFFIDLGVRHPGFPGTFLVGVECDGATYHSAKSARDRDRLREEVLVGLGWKLYRIWSTDWFADPDAETEKLSRYIELVAEERRVLLTQVASSDTRTEPAEPAPDYDQVDPGFQDVEFPEVEEPPEARFDRGEHAVVNASIANIEDDKREVVVSGVLRSPAVELGDTVTFHFDDQPEVGRVVTIVYGASHVEQNRVSRDSPIGSALLGSQVGDDVEVDTPNGARIVIVDDISKPRPPNEEPPSPAKRDKFAPSEPTTKYDSSRPQSDVPDDRPTDSVSPGEGGIYRSWEPHELPDPRETPRSKVAQYLREIIEAEGPVRVKRAYKLYVRACGIDRVGRVVKSNLNSALYGMVRQNQVLLEKEGPDNSQINAIARIHEAPKVSVRPAGDRTFWEIPPSELATVMREERNADPRADVEEIYHKVLDRYDVGRLTSNIRTELMRIDSVSSDEHQSTPPR